MSSLIWIVLVLCVMCVVATEEGKEYDELGPSSQTQDIITLADDIYNKQMECESVIAQSVEKILDEGAYYKFPVPEERYFQCKRSLDEKKRKYIKTALVGLDFYSTGFPMRLSSGRVVFLPVPGEETLSSEEQPGFDPQEELCVTNNVCLKITMSISSNFDTKKNSNENTKRFSHCVALLNDLKLEYIHVKKLDESELKKQRGLDVMCTEGAVTLFLPPQLNDLDYYITSHSMGSETSKIKPDNVNLKEHKDSGTEPTEPHNPNREAYNEVVRELNSKFEEKGKDQDNNSMNIMSTVKSRNEEPTDRKESGLKDKTNARETIPAKAQDYADNPKNHNTISRSLESDTSSSGNPNENKITSREQCNGDGISQREEVKSNVNDSLENILEDGQLSESETSNHIPATDGNRTTPDKKNKEMHREKGPTKSITRKQSKHENDEKINFVSYRVKLESKNRYGKVVEVQASGQIRTTENEVQTQNLYGLPSAHRGSTAEKVKETKRRFTESLEDSIVMMEDDCKELLQFGEQLLNQKMLGSLLSLEDHYNECLKKLDRLKMLLIEKHQLNVTSHKNVLPLRLPSGDQKFVSLPTQFLKKDSMGSLPPYILKPSDVFEERKLNRKTYDSENSPPTSREPIDDPGLIPNYKFLESLRRESMLTESSTLSKVASMLHMNGGHANNKISELVI